MFSNLFFKIQSIFLSILLLFAGMIPGGTEWVQDRYNGYAFSVDANVAGDIMGNKVSDINIMTGGKVPASTNYDHGDPMQFVEYIQLMQCTGGSAALDLFADPLNRAVKDDYNFSRLIKECRNVIALGALPCLKLGNVPLKLTTDPGVNVFGLNPYPPDDYQEYYTYLTAILNALVDEFGIDNVRKWKFCVWTEFDDRTWFYDRTLNPEISYTEFCKVYDCTVAALQDTIGEDVYVGTHAMTVINGLWDERKLLDHCVNGTNYFTGAKGTKICFFAVSFYDMNVNEMRERNVVEVVDFIRDHAEALGLDLDYGIDEGRIYYGTSAGSVASTLNMRMVGDTYQAGYDARMLAMLVNNDIDYLSAWGHMSGGAFNGYPTVAYHVANNYAKLLSNKAQAKSSTTKSGTMSGVEVDLVAGVDDASGNVSLMAYNFRPDSSYSLKAGVSVDVKLPAGFYGDTAKVTVYMVDDDANYFDEWRADRVQYKIGNNAFAWSPDDPSIDTGATLLDAAARNIYNTQLRAKYVENSKLVPVEMNVPVVDGSLKLTLSLEPHVAAFVDINP